jgi:hypothetical protein
MRALAIVLSFGLATAVMGCGGADKKDDVPDPVASKQAQDAPAVEALASPPLGKPRPKVAPLTTDANKESLLRDDPAH